MKISSIKQYNSNYAQNTIGQTSDKIKMSNPINFKGSDSFEPSQTRLNLGIDRESLPENINLCSHYVNNMRELVGRITNKDLTLCLNKTICTGTFRNKSFLINSHYGLFGAFKGYSGIADDKDFELKSKSIDNKNFMTGHIGNSSVKLFEEHSWDYSSIKGNIGCDDINVIVHYTEEGKEIEGTINNKKFAFTDNNRNIKGGTETYSDYFPIIFALILKTDIKIDKEKRRETYNDNYAEVAAVENRIGG